MKLWRPVGPKELELIEASNWKTFPPRLPEQPIFYPVCNRGYAEQIARDWNSTNAAQDYKGFVTEFEVDDVYAQQFERRIVGGQQHVELWVPAEELPEFNTNLVGPISVVARYERGNEIWSASPVNL